MSELQLVSLESLWRTFQLRCQNEPDLSITTFAAEHPDSQPEILKLFPMMKDLSEFAKDPLGHPENIGHYQVVRQIGIGGMGIVYEATSESLRERVAIKVVEASFLRGRSADRLEQEARLVATLHHSNIVPVYEFGDHENNRYYTMRFIDGPNLSEVLHHDPDDPEDELSTKERRAMEIAATLTEDWALQVSMIRQAASAIGYAHEQGILHRDVKPANMLIDDSMKLWVTDFGLAKLRADEKRMTVRSKVMGTPRYMAPEQIRGEADERSDIFGLGLALYEMVLLRKSGENGRHPIWKGGLRPPSEFNPNVPNRLERIILKAVSLDPQARHGSAKELINDLDAFTNSLGSDNSTSDRRVDIVTDSATTTLYDEDQSSSGKTFVATLIAMSLLAIAGWKYFVQNETPGPLLDKSTPTIASSRSRDNPAPEVNSATKPASIKSFSHTNKPNQPPSFAPHMFVADGNTILLDETAASYPTALEIDDDQDSTFNGLHLSITGGADKDLFAMTPVGVFAFVQPIEAARPVDANGDGIYEIEVTASDQCQAYFAQLQRSESGTYRLLQCKLSPGANLQMQTLADDIVIASGLIDIATADGSTFLHLHKDDVGSASLYQSTLTDDEPFATRLLSDDCGIDRSAVGFSTIDGRTFVIAQPDHTSTQQVSLLEATMNTDGVFTTTMSNPTSYLPLRSRGLSWLDGERFQHLRTNATDTVEFCFSFRTDARLVHMPLASEVSQFDNSSIGQAAWVTRGANSNTTIRSIKIQVVADVAN